MTNIFPTINQLTITHEKTHNAENSWWEYDARGIPLCKVCPECKEQKLKRYRKEVLNDSNYECDEVIEDDY